MNFDVCWVKRGVKYWDASSDKLSRFICRTDFSKKALKM